MTDRELMQKALVHMGINQHAVADQAPHRNVMAYNETMEELRAALEQQTEPVALIRDGVLRWHIPHEHYARPAWTAHGTHMLYTTPLQRKPLTDEQRIEVLRTTKFRDWFIAGSRGAASRAAEVAHGIGEKT